jgi:hypothetical protein
VTPPRTPPPQPPPWSRLDFHTTDGLMASASPACFELELARTAVLSHRSAACAAWERRDAARAELLPFASKKCPPGDLFGEMTRCTPNFGPVSPGG